MPTIHMGLENETPTADTQCCACSLWFPETDTTPVAVDEDGPKPICLDCFESSGEEDPVDAGEELDPEADDLDPEIPSDAAGDEFEGEEEEPSEGDKLPSEDEEPVEPT